MGDSRINKNVNSSTPNINTGVQEFNMVPTNIPKQDFFVDINKIILKFIGRGKNF